MFLEHQSYYVLRANIAELLLLQFDHSLVRFFFLFRWSNLTKCTWWESQFKYVHELRLWEHINGRVHVLV